MDVLDNPVWSALQTRHRKFSQGTAQIQRYEAGVLQVLGSADPQHFLFNDLALWLTPGEKIFTVGDVPVFPQNWKYVFQVDCIQMICEKPVDIDQPDVVKLGPADHAEMQELVNLVLPGFYSERTPLLGDYFGVRQGGKLVAMAGERMKITGFTEVSAVVTHPSFTGRGYAQQLVARVVNINLEKGEIPFLHVTATNERAKKVYRVLGFEDRRESTFCQLQYVV